MYCVMPTMLRQFLHCVIIKNMYQSHKWDNLRSFSSTFEHPVHSSTFLTSSVTHKVLHTCVHVTSANSYNYCVTRRVEMCLLTPACSSILNAEQLTAYIIHDSAAILPGVSQSVHSQLVRCVGLSSHWLAASLVRA